MSETLLLLKDMKTGERTTVRVPGKLHRNDINRLRKKYRPLKIVATFWL